MKGPFLFLYRQEVYTIYLNLTTQPAKVTADDPFSAIEALSPSNLLKRKYNWHK